MTRRFPELRFAFLEGGVGWGAQLFGDLIEHWERRNAQALEHMKPDKLDRKLLMSWSRSTATTSIAAALEGARRLARPRTQHLTGGIDESRRFRRLQVHPQGGLGRSLRQAVLFRLRGGRPDERHRVPPSGNPFGAQLNAIYSSDIGHFDVIDMRDPLPEAYELVEDGHITEDNFRDFVFANAVRLWGTQNPEFLRGHAWSRRKPRRCSTPPPAGAGRRREVTLGSWHRAALSARRRRFVGCTLRDQRSSTSRSAASSSWIR